MKFVSHVFQNSEEIAIDPCTRNGVLRSVIEAWARDPEMRRTTLDAPEFPKEYDRNFIHAGTYVLNDGDLLDLFRMMKSGRMGALPTLTEEERLKSEEEQQQIYTKLKAFVKKAFPSAFRNKMK